MPIFPKTNSAASVLFVGALSTLGGATAAYAADEQGGAVSSPSAPAELEEIVVTARYRAESLQTTPISITALKRR